MTAKTEHVGRCNSPSSATNFVGRFLRYPDLTGKRRAEGGRRLKGESRESHPGAPLVTLITVCLNSVKSIEQTFRSVQSQTYGNIEYVVVDGASSDGTLDILKAHEELIDYYVSEPDKGLYYAMNKGIELARGEYVLILNSDDWYTHDAVEALVQAKDYSGCDFTAALARYVDEEKGESKVLGSMPFDDSVYFRMPLRHETMLIPAWLYEKLGPYDTAFRIIADRDYAARLFDAGATFYEIPRALLNFRTTGISNSNNELMITERDALLAKEFPFLSDDERSTLTRTSPETYVEIGNAHLDQPKFVKACRALLEDHRANDGKRWHAEALETMSAADPGAWSESTIMPTPSDVAPYVRQPETGEVALKVAIFSTRDHGATAIGTLRDIEALRSVGVRAEFYSLFREHHDLYAHQMPIDESRSGGALRAAWRKAAVLTPEEHPGLTAREMFSKTGSVTDFRKARPIFDKADIVHMHWVSGLFDYVHADVLADKPVAWTLADMNAFTGGCHYSEGCTEYRNECRECPMLAKGSTLAHDAWKIKREAYAEIRNLHIICPSQWLADCARESSLFGDRPVHMIPNAMPVDRFTPTNRLVARRMLGLPLDRKLVAFGADSLDNLYKGGDILAAAMKILLERGQAKDVEGLNFGANSLDLGIKVHNMGHVSDEAEMSLIYAAADVFAFPSRGDNSPRAVVESLLSGTPVVGFPVGNVPELVTHKETGYIADYADAADFAEGLAWALADTDGTEALMRGVRGHVKARAHNDPETAATRYLALYYKMLERTESQLTRTGLVRFHLASARAAAPDPAQAANPREEFRIARAEFDESEITGTVVADKPDRAAPLPSVIAFCGDQALAIAPVIRDSHTLRFRIELPRGLLFDGAAETLRLQLDRPVQQEEAFSLTLPSRRLLSAERLLAFDQSGGRTDTGRKSFGIVLYTFTRTESALLVLESLKRQGVLDLVEIWMDGDQGNPVKRKALDEAEAKLRDFGIERITRHRGNLGFRKLILQSLMYMCETYDRFLVLEDDCFPSRVAVEEFRKSLDRHAEDSQVLTTYGHHFLIPGEKPLCPRFQGWGWATWSDRFKPVLTELAYLYSLREVDFTAWTKSVMTPEILARLDCTAPRSASITLQRFFAWDETLALLAALADMKHAPTGKRCIFNFGVGADSTHFLNIDFYRQPPFNMIHKNEVWDHF